MTATRPARTDDLEDLLRIAAARRTVYATYQPQFWRPAPDAVDRQRGYFSSCLTDEAVQVVVATGDDAGAAGFVIARLVPTPPVYDPGGATCLVDDFAMADDASWPDLGPVLLDAVREWAAGRGAVQLVVVTAHLDEVKKRALAGSGLTPASEWWVGSTTS